jgi:hypothetical protein
MSFLTPVFQIQLCTGLKMSDSVENRDIDHVHLLS